MLVDDDTFKAELSSRISGEPPVYPDQRICRILDGPVLTPGQVGDMLAESLVRRVVLEPGSRKLDLGRTCRRFPELLREAIAVRDQRCTEDGCRTTAARCDTDHVTEWEDLGPTSVDNGQLLPRGQSAQALAQANGQGGPIDDQAPAPFGWRLRRRATAVGGPC